MSVEELAFITAESRESEEDSCCGSDSGTLSSKFSGECWWTRTFCLRKCGHDTNMVLEADELAEREVLLERRGNDNFGFALQTFEVVHRLGGQRYITYVDYVEPHSAAAASGLMPGDVILSINKFQVINKRCYFVVESSS